MREVERLSARVKERERACVRACGGSAAPVLDRRYHSKRSSAVGLSVFQTLSIAKENRRVFKCQIFVTFTNRCVVIISRMFDERCETL